MVTTLKLEGTLASKSDINNLYTMAMEKFESMLSEAGCQMINISSSNTTQGILSKKQVVTIIWTGKSNTIKPTYTVYPTYGVFGVKSVEFREY